jgi:hypothetical protein
MKGVPCVRWSEEKKCRFVRDWSDGLDTDALRERYGINKPSAYALSLRKQGYVLPPRTTSGVVRSRVAHG